MRTETPVDPVAARRPPQLVHLGIRVPPEMRDSLTAEARRRKVEPSALLRGIIADFLRASRG